MIKTNICALVIRLQKTSWRRLCQDQYIRLSHTSSRCLQDLFKTSSKRLAKMYSRYVQDVLKTSSVRLAKTFSKCFQDVLQKRLQDIFKTSSKRFEDIFKTSWKRLAKTSSRLFQELSSSYTVLVNNYSKCIQHVSKKYCNIGYLQKDLPRSHFSKIYDQCTKFEGVIKIFQVLVFHFTTPFSGCLQRRV